MAYSLAYAVVGVIYPLTFASEMREWWKGKWPEDPECIIWLAFVVFGLTWPLMMVGELINAIFRPRL